MAVEKTIGSSTRELALAGPFETSSRYQRLFSFFLTYDKRRYLGAPYSVRVYCLCLCTNENQALWHRENEFKDRHDSIIMQPYILWRVWITVSSLCRVQKKSIADVWSFLVVVPPSQHTLHFFTSTETIFYFCYRRENCPGVHAPEWRLGRNMSGPSTPKSCSPVPRDRPRGQTQCCWNHRDLAEIQLNCGRKIFRLFPIFCINPEARISKWRFA